MVTVVKPQEQKQVKCRKCGSVLEYVFTEIQERTVADYGGGRDTYCGYCAKVNPNFYRYHSNNCSMISQR